MAQTPYHQVLQKASKIRLLITDCDGVLTDAGVYYGENGEVLKKFNIKDGMGSERLRKLANVPTAVISGEKSPSLKKRAEKLKWDEVHLGIKDKPAVLQNMCQRLDIHPEEIAYIGDDTNDIEIMMMVGLTATPKDGMDIVKSIAHYTCRKKGGKGAYREFAELIILGKTQTKDNQKDYDHVKHG